MRRGEAWILPAFFLAGAAAICAFLLKSTTGFGSWPSGPTSLQVAIGIIVVTAICRFFIYLFRLWKAGVAQPIKRISADVLPALVAYVPTLLGFVIIAILLYSMTFLKSMITAIVPFWADAPLAALDRLFFINPTRLAMALRPALDGLGIFYGLWHAVNLGGILWVLHWRKPTKARFILGYMLTWVIGMALAYAFSSAGPIFTGQYDPAIAPASVREPAEYLWSNYKAKGASLGAGISAFPSLHVAIATWFALVLRDRGLPHLGVAYAAGVFACSIILGWHYAADGVAGIALALVADWLAGLWMRRAASQQGTAIATATGASTA